jgi:hypothetical protein
LKFIVSSQGLKLWLVPTVGRLQELKKLIFSKRWIDFVNVILIFIYQDNRPVLDPDQDSRQALPKTGTQSASAGFYVKQGSMGSAHDMLAIP